MLTLLPRDLKQIVEFGCGVGDWAPMLRQMGFRGSHLMYDLYHVLLAQRYFLRYSGYPVYMAATSVNATSSTKEKLQSLPDALLSSRSVLIPSHSDLLDAYIDRKTAVLKRSMLVATFSLTESPIRDREKILKHVENFGVVYIRAASMFDEVNNTEYLVGLKRQLTKRSYAVCMQIGGDIVGKDPNILFLAAKYLSKSDASRFNAKCNSKEMERLRIFV